MRPPRIRRTPRPAVLAVAAAVSVVAAGCGSPSSVDDREPEPHDFSLQVEIGDEVIRDGGPLDADPAANRIALRDFRPESYGGHVLLDDLLIEARPENAGESLTLTTTVTPPLDDDDEESAQISAGSGGPEPFAEVALTVSADLGGYFSGQPEGYRSTVHLLGSYVAVDDAGATLEGETISHARIQFTGTATGGSGRSDDDGGDLGTVAGRLVQDEPSPVGFSPEDVTRELAGGDLDSLRGELELELGPGSGGSLPVSAELTVQALRE